MDTATTLDKGHGRIERRTLNSSSLKNSTINEQKNTISKSLNFLMRGISRAETTGGDRTPLAPQQEMSHDSR